jgi:hypothetical protein
MTDLAVSQSTDFTRLAWGAHHPEPAEATSDERLVADLERILRYTLTATQVNPPPRSIVKATGALASAKAALNEQRPLGESVELALLRAIDALVPMIRPATAASLEIAQLMEVGSVGGDKRQREIRRRVKRMISVWMWTTFAALVLALAAIVTKTVAAGEPVGSFALAPQLSTYAIPLLLGFLGACCYILRTTLRGLATQTFVLRDGADILRSILGIILGFMAPGLLANGKGFESLGFQATIVIPFLAGYAVEPIFGAVDTIMGIARDVVSHQPSVLGAKRNPPAWEAHEAAEPIPDVELDDTPAGPVRPRPSREPAAQAKPK